MKTAYEIALERAIKIEKELAEQRKAKEEKKKRLDEIISGGNAKVDDFYDAACMREEEGAIEESRSMLEAALQSEHGHKKTVQKLKEFEDISFELSDKAGRMVSSGDAESAIEIVKKSIRYNPNNQFAYINFIAACSRLHEPLGVLDLFEKAKKIDENNPTLYYNMGIHFGEIGDHERSIGYYKRCLELDPHYKDVYNNLVNALSITGRNEEAVETGLKGFEEFNHDSHLCTSIGAAYYNLGQLDKAKEFFLRSLRLNEKYTTALAGLANTLHKLGDTHGAKICFLAITRINPNDPTLCCINPEILTEDKRLKEIVRVSSLISAVRESERTKQFRPTHRGSRQEIMFYYASPTLRNEYIFKRSKDREALTRQFALEQLLHHTFLFHNMIMEDIGFLELLKKAKKPSEIDFDEFSRRVKSYHPNEHDVFSRSPVKPICLVATNEYTYIVLERRRLPNMQEHLLDKDDKTKIELVKKAMTSAAIMHSNTIALISSKDRDIPKLRYGGNFDPEANYFFEANINGMGFEIVLKEFDYVKNITARLIEGKNHDRLPRLGRNDFTDAFMEAYKDFYGRKLLFVPVKAFINCDFYDWNVLSDGSIIDPGEGAIGNPIVDVTHFLSNPMYSSIMQEIAGFYLEELAKKSLPKLHNEEQVRASWLPNLIHNHLCFIGTSVKNDDKNTAKQLYQKVLELMEKEGETDLLRAAESYVKASKRI